MGYIDAHSRTVNLGCLPAAVFGFVIGTPAAFVALMGECVNDDGHVGNCPNEGLLLLCIIGVTALLCLLITWVTNRMARAIANQGRSAGWAVIGGFAFAIALALALYAVLLALM